MLCLSPLLDAVGDTVEVENTASAFEGFWDWLLRGNTHGREWLPAVLKVCLCVISMYRLLPGPSRWLSRVCKEMAAYLLQSTLKNQHSWEHQTQDPDLGMSNLITFICISIETNMLPAANPRSQRLEFLIIITIMSYTYSRLVFWLSKKQMAKMSKMFLSQLCQVLASPLCLEIQPICWKLSHFFLVLPGSCSERRLNPAVWDGQPQMETLFHTSAAEENDTLCSESYFISSGYEFGKMYTGHHIIPGCGQHRVLIGSVTFAWWLLVFFVFVFVFPCK